ncbi:MAG: PorV/PorQ family protein [Odoribacter sp.]|nr:PorV/PorQ family protein [Odoribacter sp.]
MYKHIILISILFFILFSNKTKGQEVLNSGSALFLDITPDARSAGMGGTGVALPSETYSFYHNVASSMFSKDRGGLAYSYTPWMREVISGRILHSVGGFYKINNKQSIVAGFRHFSYDKIELSDEYGSLMEYLQPGEWSLDLGYSTLIIPDLSISLTGRYIHSDIGFEDDNAFAFDLGLFYQREMKSMANSFWSLGFQLANIGSKIKYGDIKNDLPGKLKLGGAVGLEFSEKHMLNGTLDLSYRLMPSDVTGIEFGMGAEYIFMQYGILRGGYHIADKDKSYGNYGTLGVGVNFHHLNADFSYLFADSDSAIRNTFRFTIGIGFGLFTK